MYKAEDVVNYSKRAGMRGWGGAEGKVLKFTLQNYTVSLNLLSAFPLLSL